MGCRLVSTSILERMDCDMSETCVRMKSDGTSVYWELTVVGGWTTVKYITQDTVYGSMLPDQLVYRLSFNSAGMLSG